MQKFNNIEDLNAYYLQIFTKASGFKQFTTGSFFRMEQHRLKKLYKKDFKIFIRYNKKSWKGKKIKYDIKAKKKYKQIRLEYKPTLIQRFTLIIKKIGGLFKQLINKLKRKKSNEKASKPSNES